MKFKLGGCGEIVVRDDNVSSFEMINWDFVFEMWFEDSEV